MPAISKPAVDGADVMMDVSNNSLRCECPAGNNDYEHQLNEVVGFGVDCTRHFLSQSVY
jgi:hypothetical protein